MPPPKTPSAPSAPTDSEVQALLQRHRCPTPLHALRTLFLGTIASPLPRVSPIAALSQAWGGDLPEFASSEEVEQLMRDVGQGLWNRLTLHQNVRTPFRLPRFEVLPERQALLHLSRMRAEEIKGFVDGLFGDQDELRLPRKAHDAVQALAELHQMFGAAASLLADDTRPAPVQELVELLRNLQQMTIAADEMINRALQSCKRARIHPLEAMATVSTRRIPSSSDDEDVAYQATGSDAWDEGEFIKSPLSQRVTRNGVTVQIEIYEDGDGRWILEVVDVGNASHVWDEHFETDQQALDEALRALDEEPLEFLGGASEKRLN